MLNEIYQNQIEQEGFSKESRALDRKIVGLSKTIDLEKASGDSDYAYTILTMASSYGEEKGFTRGFKYAVQLMIRCFE